MMIDRRRALLTQKSEHILIKLSERSTKTPRIPVDMSKIKTIMFTGIQNSNQYNSNILICKYNGFYVGTRGSPAWDVRNISCNFNKGFDDWADGNINTLTITDISTHSTDYVTLTWDANWTKEHFVKEIKFFDFSNSLVCHVVATREGKFLEKNSGRVLGNYSNATPNVSITDEPFEILIV